MKRFLVFWVAGVLVWAVASLPAEEPYLEFADRLRERYPDLAVDYLEKLREKAPAGLKPLVPLAIAKARLDLAAQETGAGKRATLFRVARAELEELRKGNPLPALAAEVNLQIARVIALQGKDQYSLARRAEAKDAQTREMVKARALFEEAERRLAEAVKQIDAQLATTEDEAAKDSLTNARLQAELDRGINLLDQSETYDQDDTKEVQRRGAVLEKAADLLKELSRGDRKQPVAWIARAWRGYCFQQIDDFPAARREYQAVVEEEENRAAAARGKRLARFLWLKAIAAGKDSAIKQPTAVVQKRCEEWLTLYPNDVNTREGFGVRYLLAQALFEEARALLATKSEKIKPTSLQMNRARMPLNRALALFRGLDASENDYTPKARQQKFQIVLLLAEQSSGGDLKKLQKFEDCYFRAELEFARMLDEEKKRAQDARELPAQGDQAVERGKQADQSRTKHFQIIIDALLHGLALPEVARGGVPAQEVMDAYSLLAYAHLAVGDNYRAAVYAEHLARTNPQSARAPLAATHALQAYARIIAAEEARLAGLPDDPPDPARAEVETDRKRLRQLARYMETTWPEYPETDAARHQIALMHLREKKYVEAVAILERIKPGYSGLTLARYQLALAALAARENLDKLTDAQKDAYRDQALKALEAMPAPEDADPASAQAYALGKIKLIEQLYTLQRYEQMDTLAAALQQKLAGLALPSKEEFQTGLAALRQLAAYGRAREAFQARKLEEVRKQTDPLLAQLTDQLKKGKEEEAKLRAQVDPLDKKVQEKGALEAAEKESLQDLQHQLSRLTQQNGRASKLLGGVMVLALQASVQESNTERAQALLDRLQKADADNLLEGGIAGILVQLVQQLKEQVQDLRQRKGPDAAEHLQKTVVSFIAFLDRLAEQKNLTTEVKLFLAQSYASLDRHAEAARQLAGVEPPVAAAGKEVEPRQVQLYRGARLLYLRELRLSKKFDEAQRVLDEILGTPKSPGWGQRNLEVQKEKLLLLEDRELYAGPDGAIQGWNKLMKTIRPRIQQDAKMKEHYFDCYYHLTTSYDQNALR
jgi:hypothetical protein